MRAWGQRPSAGRLGRGNERCCSACAPGGSADGTTPLRARDASRNSVRARRTVARSRPRNQGGRACGWESSRRLLRGIVAPPPLPSPPRARVSMPMSVSDASTPARARTCARVGPPHPAPGRSDASLERSPNLPPPASPTLARPPASARPAPSRPHRPRGLHCRRRTAGPVARGQV